MSVVVVVIYIKVFTVDFFLALKRRSICQSGLKISKNEEKKVFFLNILFFETSSISVCNYSEMDFFRIFGRSVLSDVACILV